MLSLRRERHLRAQVATFYLKREETITGTWTETESTERRRAGPGRNRHMSESLSEESKRHIGVCAMGDMLATVGRYNSFSRRNRGGGGGSSKLPKLRERIGAISDRLGGTRRRGTRWVDRMQRGFAGSMAGSIIADETARKTNDAAPSCVAEQLIFSQQTVQSGIEPDAALMRP